MMLALECLGILIALICAFAICVYFIERSLAVPGYHGPVSDHFDGTHFHSIGRPREASAPEGSKPPKTRQMTTWQWLLKRPKNEWKWRDNALKPLPPERVSGAEIRVTLINHATVLIQTEGLNILTDPVWAKRASPFQFAGPKRFRAPGIALEKLPKIDLILLSHNHYDHLDPTALRAIALRDNPVILTALGNTPHLSAQGILGARDMDWWDRADVANISITSVPAQHFSARAIRDRNTTLWCGFVIGCSAGDIYFAGDTGYGAFVPEIKKRFAKFRLALLPIGAYKPEQLMRVVHMSPDEALALHHELGVQTSIGIHWGTFKMADDGQDEPAERLHELIAKSPEPADFRTIENGASATL